MFGSAIRTACAAEIGAMHDERGNRSRMSNKASCGASSSYRRARAIIKQVRSCICYMFVHFDLSNLEMQTYCARDDVTWATCHIT